MRVYVILVHRDTVMVLLAVLDPEHSEQRTKRRLKRRIYRSKVFGYSMHACI